MLETVEINLTMKLNNTQKYVCFSCFGIWWKLDRHREMKLDNGELEWVQYFCVTEEGEENNIIQIQNNHFWAK